LEQRINAIPIVSFFHTSLDITEAVNSVEIRMTGGCTSSHDMAHSRMD